MTSGSSPLTLASQDIVQGCILWLGDEQETVRSFSRRGDSEGSPVVNFRTRQPANFGMFGHPIIVISRPLSEQNVIYFHQITSFAGKTLAERCSGRKAVFRQQTFCPITPAPDHPQLHTTKGRYRTLTLENGDSLEKPSYVNVREVYQMHWCDAQPYWGADLHTRKIWKLDTRSVLSLSRLTVASAGFRAGVQYKPSPPVPIDGWAKWAEPRLVTPPFRAPGALSHDLGLEITMILLMEESCHPTASCVCHRVREKVDHLRSLYQMNGRDAHGTE